ncbi:hypothetical protein SAMN04487792_0250 [Lactobacillus bombicola]|uniref:Uncharacterized protein n=1 Tax=Lactobacillus bombicola TaxID=1505723 RepID=A0A1I1RF43_9LACO|nr:MULTISPECIES: hypothetical protein [Lactobacillus]MCO6528079.1 hypothetical protein [Lactobacillus sp.]SFD30768.1 hypothetical protein SAMN04487792_0250 [Lactobacillus bombicola]
MITPEQLDQAILNMDICELDKKIMNISNPDEAKFWSTIYDRNLQLNQKEIINNKEFIR